MKSLLKGKSVATLLTCLFLIMYIRPPHVLAAAGAATHAVHGVLDASSIDFDNGKSIALNGEWEFYWSKLLVPNDFAGGKVPNDMRYLQVPGLWKPSTSGAPMSNFGYATYRLTVIVGPGTVGKPMAIYMPSVASSYNLWVDGRLLASNGVVAASPENMVPKNYRKVVHFDADRERMEVIVQVANFVQKKGGLWEPIRFGSSERIDYERDKNIVVELFVIGCLVAMGVYHMALYGGRRRDTAPLLFGTVCLAFAVRTSVLGETMAVRLIPSLNWEYVVKVEYLTVMIGLPCYIYFCYLQYPLEMKRKWVDAGLAISGLFVLTVLLTKARTFTFIIFPFQLFAVAMFAYAIYVFVLALLRKREGAVRNIVALIVMFAAIINEILYYNHLSPWSGTLLYGLPVYLFVQSINLSNRFSRSFTRSERLSKELKELNNTLEKKVKERTAALEQSNESLQEAYHEVTLLESSRRLMLSNISHELKTPLTSILGYTRALIDGVITDNVPKYLELIYQKAKILEYTFKDLLELSKLETRKVEFHYELLPAKELLRRLFEKYEWDARNKGLIVELNEMAEPFADRETMIEADPYRIEQVFANLLMNAKKFTPPGGSIVVSAAVSEDSSGIYHLTVNVADSGPGIPEDEILLIFERFYKGKHSRKIQAEGAGLGLAISKEIMDYHRGRIGVNSRPGAGSTFYFSLPVTFAKTREL